MSAFSLNTSTSLRSSKLILPLPRLELDKRNLSASVKERKYKTRTTFKYKEPFFPLFSY